MFRLAPLFVTATLVLTTPVLAQSSEQPTTTPQGQRLACSQSMPALDLGSREKPSDAKAEATCTCIWDKLSKEDQTFAEGLKEGTADSSDTNRMNRFSNNFGSALESCWK